MNMRYIRTIPARLHASWIAVRSIFTHWETPIMSFDAWLESPYAVSAEEDALHEEFQETGHFEQAFEEWVMTHKYWEIEPDAIQAEADFAETSAYADAFEAWLHMGSPR